MSAGLKIYDNSGKEVFNSLSNQLFVLIGVYNVNVPISAVGINTVRVHHPEIAPNRTYVLADLDPSGSSLRNTHSFDSLSMQLPETNGYVDIRINFKSSVPSGGLIIPILYKIFRC